MRLENKNYKVLNKCVLKRHITFLGCFLGFFACFLLENRLYGLILCALQNVIRFWLFLGYFLAVFIFANFVSD